MLKSLKFKGRYFSEETNLGMFPDNDRLSIIYGKNGSGKSTIADATLLATGNTAIEDIGHAYI